MKISILLSLFQTNQYLLQMKRTVNISILLSLFQTMASDKYAKAEDLFPYY